MQYIFKSSHQGEILVDSTNKSLTWELTIIPNAAIFVLFFETATRKLFRKMTTKYDDKIYSHILPSEQVIVEDIYLEVHQ